MAARPETRPRWPCSSWPPRAAWTFRRGAGTRCAAHCSEADLLVKEAVPDEPNVVWGLLAGIVHHAARAKAGGVTAADLMTSPAVTIGPDEMVEHAARLMYDRKVKRLPVVDQAGRLVGIVSRSDVLAVFDRTDAEIREEIMSQVITGRSEPSWYSVIVKGRRGDAGGHARDRRHRPRPGPAGPARPGRGSRARPPRLPGSPRPQQAWPLLLNRTGANLAPARPQTGLAGAGIVSGGADAQPADWEPRHCERAGGRYPVLPFTRLQVRRALAPRARGIGARGGREPPLWTRPARPGLSPRRDSRTGRGRRRA